jgi:hypothetical protein
MPVPLSYYSPIVGGLSGATKLGMEPTYYWDALDSDARRWLTEHTLPERTIDFRSFPHSWLYLRRTGDLPRRLARVDRGKPQWVVLQNRPGAFSDADRELLANGQAAYVVTKLGVPLIWVFPYADVERLKAQRANQGSEYPKRARQQFAVHPQGSLHHGEWSRSRLRDADYRARLAAKRRQGRSVLSRGLRRGISVDDWGRAGDDDRRTCLLVTKFRQANLDLAALDLGRTGRRGLAVGHFLYAGNRGCRASYGSRTNHGSRTSHRRGVRALLLPTSLGVSGQNH